MEVMAHPAPAGHPAAQEAAGRQGVRGLTARVGRQGQLEPLEHQGRAHLGQVDQAGLLGLLGRQELLEPPELSAVQAPLILYG